MARRGARRRPPEAWGELVTPDDHHRFMLKVREVAEPPQETGARGPCWEWAGHRDADGYGHFRFRGKVRMAHRFAYVAFVETTLPANLTIHHVCLNPSCVRPGHLRPMTNAENVAEGNRRRHRPDVSEG